MATQNRHTASYWKQLRRCPTLLEPARMLYDPSGSIAERLGLLVFAPALNAYVTWLLRRAMEDGIRRLYFLARDGYLVYQTAWKYCQQLGLPLECRYLYCSRYSLRIPLYHLDPEGALEHICRSGLHVTPEILLIRSGFLSEEIPALLRQLELPYADDERIPYAQLSRIRDLLASNLVYTELLRERSVQKLPQLRGYFAQEGLLEDCPIAIVDCGWTGSMQKSVQIAMNLFGSGIRLQGYYYGLYSLPADADPACYHTFAFSRKGNLLQKVFFNNNVFETVFSAPHGSTLGYIETDGTFVPILSEPERKNCELVQALERCLDAYTAALLRRADPQLFRSLNIHTMRSVSCGLFRLLMCSPTLEEATWLGTMPFSDDLMDTNRQHLAANLSGAELHSHHLVPKLLSMTGLSKRSATDSAWYEGSAVLYGRHSRWNQANHTLYKVALYLKPR